MLAPVVLFVFNRPEHTRKALQALSEADCAMETTLFIYADAPKDNSNDEVYNSVYEVRNILKEKKWCGNVNIIEQTENKGLAKSIISGVSEVVNKYGTVIVLEDDIIVSKGFLKYMNDALQLYENEDRVMHISGYTYPYTTNVRLKSDTYFLRIYSCWGWATWKRAWIHFNDSTDYHLSLLNSNDKIKKFNLDGFGDYYNQLILNQKALINTWAVKWYSSWYHTGGFSLFPYSSLTQNIGHDGTGIHSFSTNHFDVKTIDYVNVEKIPILENTSIRKQVKLLYKRIYKKSSWYNLKRNVRLFIGQKLYNKYLSVKSKLL